MQRQSKVICIVISAVAICLACGREPKGAEVDENISPLGPNGEARMWVADQDSSGTRFCFEAPDLGLPPGTPITVVHPAFPQFSTLGKLGARTKAPCFPAPRASTDSMMYSVDAPADTIGYRGVPIIILGKLSPPRMRGDTISLVIEPGRPAWQFRTCASEEGVHASAWSGTPLASQRRWHAYYYLGYDVEPTCTPADSAGL